jgi:hypothetical protein
MFAALYRTASLDDAIEQHEIGLIDTDRQTQLKQAAIPALHLAGREGYDVRGMADHYLV